MMADFVVYGLCASIVLAVFVAPVLALVIATMR
jgi:hypothetical protein